MSFLLHLEDMNILNYFRFFFKGVLRPRPILWLFVHFSQKLQHIGDKEDTLLIGNIALEYH